MVLWEQEPVKMFPQKKFIHLLVLLCLCAPCLGAPAFAQKASTKSPAAPSAWSVRWQPAQVVNGSPLLFRVTAPRGVEKLSGSWLGHDVYFNFSPKSRVAYGLAGVSLETHPGTYTLKITGTTATGKTLIFDRRVQVRAGRYKNIAVKVATKFTEPSATQLKKISEDKSLKQDVLKQISSQREWRGGFRPPVKATVSDVFGTRRTFNGETRSVHQGLDYAVPSGTPIAAVNSGTVLLARPLYFEGNCVVLDHGQGLLTLYMHMSEFKVKEGEAVTRGQILGLSGGTGRATGPHLHVAVRWQGVYLNPATLLKLKLP